jgi:hypothetical protein
MKIAFDVDEVLIDFVSGYFDYAKGKGYPEVKFGDIHTYNLWNLLGSTMEEAYDLAHEYHDSESFEKAPLIIGAKEGIMKLKNHEHYFITHRPERWKDKTFGPLKAHFLALEERLYFAGGGGANGDRTKEQICDDLGIKLIVDDRGDYGIKYADAGLKVLMPDRPWNQEYSHNNITRCFSWPEIVENVGVIENG